VVRAASPLQPLRVFRLAAAAQRLAPVGRRKEPPRYSGTLLCPIRLTEGGGMCRQRRGALLAARPVSAAVGGPVNAALARQVAPASRWAARHLILMRAGRLKFLPYRCASGSMSGTVPGFSRTNHAASAPCALGLRSRPPPRDSQRTKPQPGQAE
jgi:hypothetical protein